MFASDYFVRWGIAGQNDDTFDFDMQLSNDL
jgi:hypothetical protein